MKLPQTEHGVLKHVKTQYHNPFRPTSPVVVADAVIVRIAGPLVGPTRIPVRVPNPIRIRTQLRVRHGNKHTNLK